MSLSTKAGPGQAFLWEGEEEGEWEREWIKTRKCVYRVVKTEMLENCFFKFNFFIIWSFTHQLSKHAQLEDFKLNPGYKHFSPPHQPPPLFPYFLQTGQVLKSPGLMPRHPIMWNRRQNKNEEWEEILAGAPNMEQKFGELTSPQFQSCVTEAPGSHLCGGCRMWFHWFMLHV